LSPVGVIAAALEAFATSLASFFAVRCNGPWLARYDDLKSWGHHLRFLN
jgi:hypothetical protein